MKILDRKNTVNHVLDSIDYQPILRSMAQSAVDAAFAGTDPAIRSRRSVAHLARPLKKMRTPGLVAAAALAGVAGVSAAVSSERRRSETA